VKGNWSNHEIHETHQSLKLFENTPAGRESINESMPPTETFPTGLAAQDARRPQADPKCRSGSRKHGRTKISRASEWTHAADDPRNSRMARNHPNGEPSEPRDPRPTENEDRRTRHCRILPCRPGVPWARPARRGRLALPSARPAVAPYLRGIDFRIFRVFSGSSRPARIRPRKSRGVCTAAASGKSGMEWAQLFGVSALNFGVRYSALLSSDASCR
jgi:hypothetical protein